MGYTSVYDLFKKQVEKYGDKTFLRHKVRGRWIDVSWNEMDRQVEAIACGLIRLGIEPEHAVGILSNSCVNWVLADMAIVSCACITTAAYPTSPPKDVAYVLGHAETPLVFVQDEQQLEKVLKEADNLPELKYIVVFDNDIIDPDDRVMTMSDLMDLGTSGGPHVIAEHKIRAEVLDRDHLLTFIYTSGTTGPPKGAMLTHGNALYIAETSHSMDFVAESDESLSFLPLAHALERVIFYCSIISGGVVNFAENIYSVAENLPEVKPTVLVCVPRVLEKIYEKVIATVEESSEPKKKVFRWAVEIGAKKSELEQRQKKVPALLEAQYAIADALVFKKIREKTGGNIRWLGSGGAPLSEEVNRFFNAAGLQIIQAYGLTETSAPAILTPVGEDRIGRVGKRMPGCDCEIAEDGEIIIRGPNVFAGYFKNEEATEACMRDGWFLSGDTGEFDEEGYLKITGRKKDLIITAGGKNITPQKLELTYSSIPLVSQVVIAGDGKKYLTALFTLSEEELEQFAKDQHLKPDNGASLALHPKVREVIKQGVEEKNRDLPKYEAIKDFRIVPGEFTVDSGELTPTMKVKKNIVLDKYKSTVAEMYQK